MDASTLVSQSEFLGDNLHLLLYFRYLVYY
jgi:hypothetical protein